jgi:hypothetical protein
MASEKEGSFAGHDERRTTARPTQFVRITALAV